MNVTKSCMDKRSFQNAEYEKLIHILSDSVTTKELSIVEFWFGIKKYSKLSERLFLKYTSLSHLYICMRPDFLYILQPK